MPFRPRPFQETCIPPSWARGGHAQTLLGHALPWANRVAREPGWVRREVVLEDGERLVALERPGTSGVRVHLFHGLSGDADADYMRGVARSLAHRGHGVWRVNHRGCGAGQGLATQPYHSGSSADMRAVLAASRADAPRELQLVIGFSLSGNIALLLAGQGLEPLPDGLIAVNPPVDLARASRDIGRGLSRLYELRFVLRLRRAVAERDRIRGRRDRAPIPRRASLMDFDDLFTAPEAGFADGADYYRRCSSLPHLERIGVPAVIVSAADDPFVAADTLRGARLSATTHLHLEASGGHLGYLERRGALWGRWLEGALVHYVDELAGR